MTGQTKAVFDSAFKGMEDAFVKFVQTGKLSFTDLARSVISDIARMMIKAAEAKVFGYLSTIFTAGVGSSVGSASAGAVNGAAGNTFTTPVYTAGYGGTGMSSIASANESSFAASLKRTASASASSSGTSGGVAINFGDINVQGGSTNAETAAALKASLLRDVVPVIKDTIRNQQRTGGMLAA